jgi:hypothetical protein
MPVHLKRIIAASTVVAGFSFTSHIVQAKMVEKQNVRLGDVLEEGDAMRRARGSAEAIRARHEAAATHKKELH